MNSSNTYCLIAARSGGHIIPALTLGKEALDQSLCKKLLLITTSGQLDLKIAQQAPSPTIHVPLHYSPLRMRSPFSWIKFLTQTLYVFCKSYFLFKSHKPNRVLSMGGYISLPVCYAAYLARIPIDLYELNAQPGKAVTWIAPRASKIYCCFEAAMKYFPASKTVLVSYPIRFDTTQKISAEKVLATLSFDPKKKTIFIMGGSQGSLFINQIIKSWIELSSYMHPLIQIIHQVGSQDTFAWKAFYHSYGIKAYVFSFQEDMNSLYQISDFIVSRAGAGALFEALYFQKKCIIIPLETKSTSHQKDNAYEFHKKYPELFTVILEKDIKTNNTSLFGLLNSYCYAKHNVRGVGVSHEKSSLV